MKVNKEIKSVMWIAFKDISNYLDEKNKKPQNGGGDVWQTTPVKMNNKKTRSLNKLLGISNVNYYNNTNGIK